MVGMAPNKEAWRAWGDLYVVADGMVGARRRRIGRASLAVDTIRLSYTKARGMPTEDAIKRAIIEANATIHERGQKNREFEGMGTTATALILGPEGAIVGHVGDSRCYRIRGEYIEQISYDHSLVWEVARRHNVPPEDIKTVPKNIIVRSLGPEAQVNVDVNGPYKVLDGDRFLLCTDGLSGQVTDREIWSIVSYLPPEEACEFLINLANYRGGIDNVSLILVQVGDPAHPIRDQFSDRSSDTSPREKNLRFAPPETLARFGGKYPVWPGIGQMKYYLVPGPALDLAVLGVLMVLTGLAWFTFISYRRKRLGDPVPPAPPPVYRSLQCSLQPNLVEKLAKNEVFLRETAQEHEWKVNWDVLARHRAQAEKHMAENNLPGAFLEYCRSLGTLFAGMRQARNKQEVFDPHWQSDQV